MIPLPSPSRIVLLAAHLAAKSDVQSLTALAAQHTKVLRQDLLLRILLTCLPETLPPSQYTPLVQNIESGSLETEVELQEVDWSSVQDITDDEAAKKVRKLRLLPLIQENATINEPTDPVSLFLIHRARRVDEEAGLLTQLPDLIVPFLDHAPCIRTWMVSVLLPLLRRNHEYYPHNPSTQTLSAFDQMSDRAAVDLLLSQTGACQEDLAHVGRDLRGLVGPWLYNEARWVRHDGNGYSPEDSRPAPHITCPGWERVLEWITMQASKSWRVAVRAIDQWDGPGDVDLGGHASMWLEDEEQEYLEQRYARAALASAYLIPEASVEALKGVNSIITKIMTLLGQDPCPTLQVSSSLLPPFTDLAGEQLLRAQNATYMRNDLLAESNTLTTPTETSTQLLHILTLSAFILSKGGVPCTIRRAGELAFLQDEREQKVEAENFIHSLSNNGPKSDDKYWVRARNELLWLQDWGAEEVQGSPSNTRAQGIFGQLKREFLEIECLKAFLGNTRYSLARSIYEDVPEKPLNDDTLRETVVSSAMNAYDNASNPHRGRGGLLKCDDIIHSFPRALGEAHPASKRIEALLKATHALSEYRLMLKKGEPFTPVILRVHPDPVSIIGKVLEQNPKSYTRIQDFLEIGSNMTEAGLGAHTKPDKSQSMAEQVWRRSITEKRITAMCVDAALTEDDFETAYSYVVNRLAADSRAVPAKLGRELVVKDALTTDDYSWKAALQAGKYRRTARTIKPTHIGTASGNLDIRHLGQRMECLATALRVAPAAALQEILNVFRKCEEELNAAVKAEEEQESAWDDQGDLQAMPGAFSSTVPAGVVRSAKATSSRQVEEAPMSLFDLSRASMARAQRNLTALSSLQRSENTRSDETDGETGDGPGQQKVRKRDQLREAAVGTLASGVGWLIGAQPIDRGGDRG
ncbi:secretory pathway Sec39 [Annulohypoxylon maeteangense]|uniref:secretory pathway Sec39 n=1 Tax=Annulohypoxylon maeteangense TaxID=1927788 RepID=UPI002007A720|nr:secretory pathway Sec39 [Annulohypoxylon maeteangense]KAI0881174.1 secretory pathway Sec39 [Annulohypoxylon maeteangense]